MPGKRPTVVLIVLVLAACAFAADAEEQGPAGFSFVLGPRIGASYIVDSPEHFSSSINALYSGSYFPALTLFGLTMEQRILLGETGSHFAFQEVVLIGGLEQGIALPEGAVLVGYRDYSGFEFGIGPILHVGGISVVAAIGWTFSYRGAYIPVDISVILPNTQKPASISLTTGFNFQIGRRELREPDEAQKAQGTEDSGSSRGQQGPK